MKKNLSLIALTFLMLISFSFKSIVANEENNPYKIHRLTIEKDSNIISIIKKGIEIDGGYRKVEIFEENIYVLHNNQRYDTHYTVKERETTIDNIDFSKKIQIFKDEEKVLDFNLSDTYIPEIKNSLVNNAISKTAVNDMNNISDEEIAKARTNVIEFLKTKNINISEDDFSYYKNTGRSRISLNNLNDIIMFVDVSLEKDDLFELKTNETLKNEFIKENEELLNTNLDDITFAEYEKVKDSLTKLSEMNDELKESLVDEKAKLDEIKAKLDPINNSLKGIIEMININYREHNDAISNRNDINKDEARKEVDRIFNAYKDKLNALKTLDETNELSRSYRDIFISFNLDSYKIQQPQPSVSSTPTVSTPKETLPSTGSKDINFMVLGLTLISISLYTLINKKS